MKVQEQKTKRIYVPSEEFKKYGIGVNRFDYYFTKTLRKIDSNGTDAQDYYDKTLTQLILLINIGLPEKYQPSLTEMHNSLQWLKKRVSTHHRSVLEELVA